MRNYECLEFIKNSKMPTYISHFVIWFHELQNCKNVLNWCTCKRAQWLVGNVTFVLPSGCWSQTPVILWRNEWFTGISVSLTKTPAAISERKKSNPSNAYCARNPNPKSAWRSLWSTVTSATIRLCLYRNWWDVWESQRKRVSQTIPPPSIRHSFRDFMGCSFESTVRL